MLKFQAKGKITSEGVFLEQLETDPSKYMPEVKDTDLGGDVIKVNLLVLHTDFMCQF